MPAARKPAASSSSVGRIEFSNVPISLLILFGLWVCYEAGCPGPMPHPSLEWLKTLGLFLFRSEFGLQAVFWTAVVVHIFEGALGLRAARDVNPRSIGFQLFWLVQTLLIGYPSLSIIQAQASAKKAQE